MLREGMMIVDNRNNFNCFPSRGSCRKATDEVCQKGISLISLIITIIVIIILASIVIFSGFGATESAQFAKFAQEFSSYQEELNERYQNEKLHSSMQGENKLDSTIYAEITGDGEQTISSLFGGETLPDRLNGTNCYEIQGARSFYSGQGGVYITDKGEVFTLPGYRYNQNGEERRYVTSSKYYTEGSTGTGETSTGEIVEMTGAPTVEGTIAVGDYVEYTPDVTTYTYNEVPAGESSGDYYLGHQDLGILTTDTATKWRVVRINDGEGENGEILITPADAVNSLRLSEAPGYLNSVRVLDYICGKLYSNSALGTKARSMKQEDLDLKETGGTRRYAYYVNGIEGMPATITVNGKEYTCKEHESTSTYRFCGYDEGTSGECIKTYATTVNGETYTYSYAMPIGDKPVLVTYKFMSIGSKYDGAKAVIGVNYGWLASSCINLGSTCVFFGVREACSSSVLNIGLTGSYGYVGNNSDGVRPLVTLGSGLQLSPNGQIDGVTNWEITKSN